MRKFQSALRANQPVFLDTSCFIYAFEEHDKFGEPAAEIFDLLSEDELKAFSSIVTVAEVLAKPFEKGDEALAARYHEVFKFLPNFSILSPDYKTATLAAEVRGDYGFGLLDSFQLALSVKNNCKLFVTNDKQLKQFEALKVVCLSDFV